MTRYAMMAMLLVTGGLACSSAGSGSPAVGTGGSAGPNGGSSSPGTGGSGGAAQGGGRSGTGGVSSGGVSGSGGPGQGGSPSQGGGTAGTSKGSGGAAGGGTTGTVSGGGGLATGGGGLTAGGGAIGSGGRGGSDGGLVGTGGGGPGGSKGGAGGTTSPAGGATSTGGLGAGGGTGLPGSGGSTGACSGPIGTFSGALADGIKFLDDQGKPVNAHGGGIIKDGDTYYMHGEYFLSTTTDNNFNGFSMYSSKDLSTWKNEGIILPQQASGELGPSRKGERPHIIKCPSTGEFVLYAHAASSDYQTDKEVVYATSTKVNGQYAYKGPLTNASGQTASHSDMSAVSDGTSAYVITESGHVYSLASDCHSWTKDQSFGALNGDSGGVESPTVFKAGSTYYWIGSYKTGWRANNNFYSTAPSMTGPWTYQGFVAPVADKADELSDERTWLSQSTWVMPVVGCQGTVYVYWGDHWYGNQDTSNPGKHNDQATYVFQPLVFDGIKISMPTYLATWKLDVGAGTWAP